VEKASVRSLVPSCRQAEPAAGCKTPDTTSRGCQGCRLANIKPKSTLKVTDNFEPILVGLMGASCPVVGYVN
jgi:hypothetical protein